MPRKPGPDAGRVEFDLSGLVPVSVPRLSDTIAERIRRFIVSQDLQPGTRLPSERALAERFGASRATISQAIRTLSLMGLVDARRGSGAYVLRRPDKAPLPQLWAATPANLDQLLELRLWLESLGVREAIGRADEVGLREARAALERLIRSVGEPATWIAADTVFHATLVGLAGNPLLTALYEQVHTTLMEYEFRHWVDRERVPDWLQPSQAPAHLALHEPIVDALERRDVAAALATVERHSAATREHIRSRPGDGERSA